MALWPLPEVWDRVSNEPTQGESFDFKSIQNICGNETWEYFEKWLVFELILCACIKDKNSLTQEQNQNTKEGHGFLSPQLHEEKQKLKKKMMLLHSGQFYDGFCQWQSPISQVRP